MQNVWSQRITGRYTVPSKHDGGKVGQLILIFDLLSPEYIVETTNIIKKRFFIIHLFT